MSDLIDALMTQAFVFEQMVADTRRQLLEDLAEMFQMELEWRAEEQDVPLYSSHLPRSVTSPTMDTSWLELTQDTALDAETVRRLSTSVFDG
jgi:hypothetical protein